MRCVFLLVALITVVRFYCIQCAPTSIMLEGVPYPNRGLSPSLEPSQMIERNGTTQLAHELQGFNTTQPTAPIILPEKFKAKNSTRRPRTRVPIHKQRTTLRAASEDDQDLAAPSINKVDTSNTIENDKLVVLFVTIMLTFFFLICTIQKLKANERKVERRVEGAIYFDVPRTTKLAMWWRYGKSVLSKCFRKE